MKNESIIILRQSLTCVIYNHPLSVFPNILMNQIKAWYMALFANSFEFDLTVIVMVIKSEYNLLYCTHINIIERLY